MSTITIDVRKKHLDVAVKARGNSSTLNCLLAQAVKQAFPKKYVQVGYTTATIGTGKRRKVFDLYKKAQRLIDRFDRYVNGPDPVDKRGLVRLRAALPTSFTMVAEA